MWIADGVYSARALLTKCLPEQLKNRHLDSLLKVSTCMNGTNVSQLRVTERYYNQKCP